MALWLVDFKFWDEFIAKLLMETRAKSFLIRNNFLSNTLSTLIRISLIISIVITRILNAPWAHNLQRR